MKSNACVKRHPDNPIIKTCDIKPSLEGLEVVGVFNPAAFQVGEEIFLLMRVAEACIPEKGWIKVPVMDDRDRTRIKIRSWKIKDHSVDLSDPRKFKIEGKTYLTSLSHLRLAKSRDGVHFTIDDTPFLLPQNEDELFGVEDPRVTRIEDTFYITYTAVSQDGFGVSLASTRDFTTVTRHGMIFPPQNKDVALFPQKIGGRFVALHRPTIESWGSPSVWYAESTDLRHWGGYRCLLRPRENRWEREKIGVGPQPIKTPHGWLVLYHGCGEHSVYSLHLALLDPEDPRQVVKRSLQPMMTPQEPYEKEGFFPNVVFSNGWLERPDGALWIYYGAADESIAVARTSVEDLLGCFDEST